MSESGSVPVSAEVPNVYGWFERTERGVYCLTALGAAALLRWPCILIPL